MMFWGNLNFQDALNMTLEQIIYFHDYLMMIVVMILVVVGYLLIYSLFSKEYSSNIVANHLIESIWTVLPIVVLILLVYPSIYLLYLIDENSTNFLCTLKLLVISDIEVMKSMEMLSLNMILMLILMVLFDYWMLMIEYYYHRKNLFVLWLHQTMCCILGLSHL